MSHLIITSVQVESRIDEGSIVSGQPKEISIKQQYDRDGLYMHFTLEDFEELRVGIDNVVVGIIKGKMDKTEDGGGGD